MSFPTLVIDTVPALPTPANDNHPTNTIQTSLALLCYQRSFSRYWQPKVGWFPEFPDSELLSGGSNVDSVYLSPKKPIVIDYTTIGAHNCYYMVFLGMLLIFVLFKKRKRCIHNERIYMTIAFRF